MQDGPAKRFLQDVDVIWSRPAFRPPGYFLGIRQPSTPRSHATAPADRELPERLGLGVGSGSGWVWSRVRLSRLAFKTKVDHRFYFAGPPFYCRSSGSRESESTRKEGRHESVYTVFVLHWNGLFLCCTGTVLVVVLCWCCAGAVLVLHQLAPGSCLVRFMLYSLLRLHCTGMLPIDLL